MLRILVVDDEAPIRDWIVYCIEKLDNNMQVIGTAMSGKEAYEMIMEKKPGVVITDIKMPGMDGIELMQTVKKTLPYTVFIILTNFAEFSYAKKAITYGAKEYLLKSELRSVDLENVLNRILEDQAKLIESKNSEILSNGYVDLYSLYQNYENKAYNASFWNKLGMDSNKPYCLISVNEDITLNQRQVLNNFAQEIEPYYYNFAYRQQIIFIIIQDSTKASLKEKVHKFTDHYFHFAKQYIAVGEIHDDLDSFMKAMDEILSVVTYCFFIEENEISYYSQLAENTKMDRYEIREQFKNILSLMALKQYENAIDAINSWFDNYTAINVLDIIWAKDICIKLVIAMEDRFWLINPEAEFMGAETSELNSVLKCRETCLGMVSALLPKKTGVRSKPISEALSYIHKNYNKDISLIEVAKHVYRSPEYFSRQFKEEVGLNFSVYLTMYRLNYAEQLLKTSKLQISQIAYDVGYTNPGYFSRIFKKYMGITPEEARSQNTARRAK